MAQALNVWMNGELVAVWSSSRGGTPTLRYEPSWLRSPSCRALSLSLPLTTTQDIRGDVVDHYFDNLLPDSASIRRRLGRRFKAKSTSSFDLLSAIGRDCVGAIALLPPKEQPKGWNHVAADAMSDADVAQHLHAATSSDSFKTGDASADFRISIAGAQEKTALLRMAGKWWRPLGSTPTTHILKLPLGLVGNMQADMSQSVQNEWLCAQILQAMGIPTAHTEMARFEQQLVLVVQRFDRQWINAGKVEPQSANFSPSYGTWIARLPQEDFCQAFGMPSTAKYESDGGPGAKSCLRLLSASDNAQNDQSNFIKAQFIFWLLAATDGHSKNFSVHHRRGGTFRMTPLYDVLSAWPIIGKSAKQLPYQKAKMAMAAHGKNTHYHLAQIKARHWHRLAHSGGTAAQWEQLIAVASSTQAVLSEVQAHLPADFPQQVWGAVSQGVQTHANQFLNELT